MIGLYGRGMTVREIQGHLLELYGLEVSPELISPAHRRAVGQYGALRQPERGGV